MKSLETLVLTTTLVMGCMSALAQNTDADSDPVHAGDIAPKPEIMPARNGVIRYSAGDSIPLGFSPPTQKPSVPESAQVPAIEVPRDRAGDSIPLALPAAQNTPGVENTPAQPAVPQTRLGRYTAGESIALSYPSASQADLRAAAAAQKSVPGYSGAANIPLAGALGDDLGQSPGLGGQPAKLLVLLAGGLACFGLGGGGLAPFLFGGFKRGSDGGERGLGA